MPVYNREEYLSLAIDSILNQEYSDFELIILLEHGCNNNCKEIVFGYTDERIRVVENKEKLGLPQSLNKGILLAKGEYIARMDSDDISYPQRIGLQVKYLDTHKDISLVGTLSRINGSFFKKTYSPEKSCEIKFEAFFLNPFVHPSVMWRKVDFMKNNFFYKNVDAEDYELWTRVVEKLKCYNLQKYLLFYRIDGNNKTTQDAEDAVYIIQKQMYERYNIPHNILGAFFNGEINERELLEREKLFESVCNMFTDYSDVFKVLTIVLAKLYSDYDYLLPIRAYRRISYLKRFSMADKLFFCIPIYL